MTEPNPLDVPPAIPGSLVPENPSAPPVLEAKGMRSTTAFPADPSRLSREEIEHHYRAMRNSHDSLVRSRGQLIRRSKEFSLAREKYLKTLQDYENRLAVIGQEKVEAMQIAQEMHREMEAFDEKQRALDKLLTELDDAKEQTGFWGTRNIIQLVERMRRLLRGEGKINE
jgi:hypothetical protein